MKGQAMSLNANAYFTAANAQATRAYTFTFMMNMHTLVC